MGKTSREPNKIKSRFLKHTLGAGASISQAVTGGVEKGQDPCRSGAWLKRLHR